MTPGSICIAQTHDHVCVTPSNLTFSCPKSNLVEREPQLESGNYSLRCRVCGMLDDRPLDTDPTEGRIVTTLFFGPNALEGSVDEDVVLGYSVYFADNCSRKIGETIAYVAKRGLPPTPCCQFDAYTVELDVPYPENETNVSLMVVPYTTVGDLTSGMTTFEIVDYIDNTTYKRAVANGARRSAKPSHFSSATSLAALLASLVPSLLVLLPLGVASGSVNAVGGGAREGRSERGGSSRWRRAALT